MEDNNIEDVNGVSGNKVSEVVNNELMDMKKNPGILEKKMGRPIKWTEEAAMGLADGLLEWMENDGEDGMDNLWVEKYLYEVFGTYPSIISDLAIRYPNFSKAIKKAKEIQKRKVIEYALKNKVNVAMAIFILKNNHGWSDKTETTHAIKEQPLFGDPIDITPEADDDDPIDITPEADDNDPS